MPIVGRHYKHYKGGIYRVTGLTLDGGTGEPRVLYESAALPIETWDRPVEDWNVRVDDTGKRWPHCLPGVFPRRFTLIEEEEDMNTTMKTITAYKLADGRIFENAEEAGKEDNKLAIKEELWKLISGRNDYTGEQVHMIVSTIMSNAGDVRAILTKER